MATINYLVKGNDNPATIYLRFKHGSSIDITRSTDFLINPKDWHSKSKRPIQRDGGLKNLSTDLFELSNQIIKDFNNSNVKDINGPWLERRIMLFRGINGPENEESELLIDWIQKLIDTANTRENGKGTLGLSKSRTDSYKNLKRIVQRFQGKKQYRVNDVNLKFATEFLNWMINDQKYSEGYSRKKLDDIKTVCNNSEIYGIETNRQLRHIKSSKHVNTNIVYLNPSEIEKITDATLVSDKLQNARKWLLLGCLVGQRGGDLLRITDKNFVTRNGLPVIELKQQKTDKQITIPILDETEDLLSDGLPHYISIQKLNEYIKEVCKIAGIIEPIEGFKYDKKTKRKVKGIFPKYKLITSHVCRRSFATNLYGFLPTPLIMQITAHSTEKMLLKYIGKSSYDYAQQIADFYTLQGKKKEKEPQLSVIRNVENQ